MASGRAIFLDRDGTVIYDRGYLRDPEGIELIPGAVEALRALAGAGWKLVVVSNQSGVSRGLITLEEVAAVQARFEQVLLAEGIALTAAYLCTHPPEGGCECRKPAPGSILRAAREHGIDPAVSYMIGDRQSDIECGRTAGCATIWLRNAEHAVAEDLPDHVADHWAEIYERIGGA